MKLHELYPAAGATKEVKRIGRGHGSGHGMISAAFSFACRQPVKVTRVSGHVQAAA